MKKIAIVGTHGVGKSFLCKQIHETLLSLGKKSVLIDEVVRKCPFPINDQGSGKTCEWIVHSQYIRELEAELQDPDYIVCDRSVLDPLVYYAHTKEGMETDNKQWMLEYYTLFKMKWYDAIILVTPDKRRGIDGDGFRDTNKEFQLAIHKTFERKLRKGPGLNVRDKTRTIEQNKIYSDTKQVIAEILLKTVGL